MKKTPPKKLSELAYYRTGGGCDLLLEPTTIDELADAVREVRSKGMRFFLLGGGTNSLVLNEHWPGAVIAFHQMARIEVQGDVLYVEAGVDNSAIAQVAQQQALSGAAWMYRLPGQLGGTVRMNARCYGGEISQIVKRVHCVSPEGERREYADQSIFRGYKNTLFMETGDIIAAAELQLAPGNGQTILEKMQSCEKDRVAKGQFLFPSCGCVFKNDYEAGAPSGMLLERAGVKALRVGKAEVSPAHANFVFNKGCSSHDILELSFKMRDAVYAMFGVWLEYEMEILGDIPVDVLMRLREKKPLSPTPALEEARRVFAERPSS